jgi:acetamidase/formamidase
MAHVTRLAKNRSHLAWDNALAPATVVAPGEIVELELHDASGGQITAADDASAIGRLDFAAVNPCTGPVFVEGALPGDDLVVTLLDVATSDWGWTANIPGFGLLADDFPEAHLRISTVRDSTVTLLPGVEIASRPMIGTIGVAPAAAGQTPLLVLTDDGGNMDIAQLCAGTRLHLPVRVPGALLSAGDAHVVQGDGEICGTGVETNCILRARVDLVSSGGSSAPWFEHSVRPTAEEWTATTGIGPDLLIAARDAARRAVDLIARTGLDPVDAYLLLSLVGELRISEVVDAPNWVVSLHVPRRYVAV